jgi:hypothetical protein
MIRHGSHGSTSPAETHLRWVVRPVERGTLSADGLVVLALLDAGHMSRPDAVEVPE